MDGRFSISMHILTLLAQADGEWRSSDFLAGSININPALVRKEVGNLHRHGLVESKEGKNGGSKLAKPAAQITLADVFGAVQHGAVLGLSRNRPNPNCPVGQQIGQHLKALELTAEKALVQKLGDETLENFVSRFV